MIMVGVETAGALRDDDLDEEEPMRRDKLPILNPCDMPWSEMDGGQRRRHCEACDEKVHNLSAMTEAEARELVERRGDDGICIQYQYDSEDGTVLFRDSDSSAGQGSQRGQLASQRWGVRRLLGAAAVSIPLLVGGCDDPGEQPVAQQGVEASAIEPAGGAADSTGDDELTLRQLMTASNVEAPGAGWNPSLSGEEGETDDSEAGQPADFGDDDSSASVVDEELADSSEDSGAQQQDDEQSDDEGADSQPNEPVVRGRFLPPDRKPDGEDLPVLPEDDQ